tara:strand:- start:472 stop:936 length:465 start_codon:yes stop_codon:yes gene_type:complete
LDIDKFSGRTGRASKSSYNNYYYDPYGNYSFSYVPENHYYFEPNGGNYSWNSSNIGIYHFFNGTANDTDEYFKLIDNSYFCGHYDPFWYLYCHPYLNYSIDYYDPYGNNNQWGMDNYYYDPYNGNFSFDDMYDSYYFDDVYGGSYSWNFSFYYD